MADDIRIYYQAIENGQIPAGKWVRLLYERIISGIDSGEYIYSEKKANNAVKFIEKFVRHNKGRLAPRLLKLSLWQRALISCIFGVLDQDGRRQFREVFVVVGRKTGKTLIAAAIMAYIAYVDGEFGSEIYCVAPKLDQSDLVYSAFEFTEENNATLNSLTKRKKYGLLIERTNTTVKKIAFNEKKADGYNPMLTVADEMSSWPAARGLKQYEVMVSGTGAREEPITLAISSSGYVNDGIYDELMLRSTRFLLGDSKEKRLLPFLYMIDDIQCWDDVRELTKSLPGLGVSVSVDFILGQIDIASGSLSKKAEFLAKYCNVKQNSSQAWLSAEIVNNCYGESLTLEDFRGSYCVGGIDLSQTTDLTSCCIVIEKDEILYVFSIFFIPGEKLQEASERDGLPYRIYEQRGLLKLSGDNFINYVDCLNWYKMLVEQYEILPLQVGYDRYSAQYLVQDMEQYGFHMDDVYQGYNLSPVIREAEGLMRDGKIKIGDNDLLKTHMFDAALKMDNESNKVKLVKLSNNMKTHIDGIAALIDALTVRQKHYGEIGGQLKNEG